MVDIYLNTTMDCMDGLDVPTMKFMRRNNYNGCENKELWFQTMFCFVAHVTISGKSGLMCLQCIMIKTTGKPAASEMFEKDEVHCPSLVFLSTAMGCRNALSSSQMVQSRKTASVKQGALWTDAESVQPSGER